MKNLRGKRPGGKLFEVATLLKHYSALSYLVFSFGVLTHSYLQLTYSETISFFVRDSWCDSNSQGIGIHCFGDFYQPVSVASNSNPWGDSNLAYTPINFLYFKLLNNDLFLGVDARVPLGINMILVVFSLSIPSIHLMRSSSKKVQNLGKWALIASLASGPSLTIIDRGNSSFLLFPFLYFFFIGLIEKNIRLSLGMLIAITIWRPQALLFSLGLLPVFGFKALTKGVVLSLLALCSSFVLYPKSILLNLATWFKNSRDYQNYVDIPAPGNFSIVNFVGLIDGFIHYIVNPGVGIQGIFRSGLSSHFVSLFTFIFTLMVIVLIVIRRNRIEPIELIFVLTIFFILSPGITFGYYLILLLLPMLIFGRLRSLQTSEVVFDKPTWVMYLFLLFLVLPSWPLNWQMFGLGLRSGWESYGIHWSFAQAQLSLLGVFLVIRLLRLRAPS